MDPITLRMHACMLARVPANLIGPPGGGKTARVQAYARANKLHLERLLLSRCEPIDLKPRVYHDGKVIVARAPEIDRLIANHENATSRLPISGILFLDELNRASREVEGAALDLIDDPPPGVAVIVAMNPPSRGQAARTPESATANRLWHGDVSAPDASAYASALLMGWGSPDASSFPMPDPDVLARETAQARGIGSAFIRHRGVEVLSAEPTNPAEAGGPWPSPRSWDMALRLHAVARALSFGVEDTVALLAGCVGPMPGAKTGKGSGLAVEFLAFAADAEIDPEALLADPQAWVPPVGRVDRTIAAFAMVVGAVTRDPTNARWHAAWELVGKACDSNQADAALFAANELLKVPSRGLAQAILTPAHKLMPERIEKILLSARRAGGGK